MKKKILIIRLDAIGDYILWRNCLHFIRYSAAYRDAHITVLGNPAWKNIAETLDGDCADEWIWAENRNSLFRQSFENLLPGFIWERRVNLAQRKLRDRLIALHFEEIILPQVFHDPQIDALAYGIAPATIGVAGTCASHARIINTGNNPFVFLQNRSFAEELTGERCTVSLAMELPAKKNKKEQAIFFTGASHWTRRWPMKRWHELQHFVESGIGLEVKYAGRPEDPRMPLCAFAMEMESSRIVVSNDTMALHMAAALKVPAVGIVNGVSGKDSFWPYPPRLRENVAIVAPTKYKRCPIPGLPGKQITQYGALASITAENVFTEIKQLL